VNSRIIQGPENTLVVRCKDDYANMTCVGDATDEITWWYDGNEIINAQCLAVVSAVFMANRESAQQCGVAASLKDALNVSNIISISGPYGCSDQTNDGVTNTSLAIALGMFASSRRLFHFQNIITLGL